MSLWGSAEADGIQLWRENHQIIDLVVRFDLRRPNIGLIRALVEVASTLDLAILDYAQRRVLARDPVVMLRAAAESGAAHFVIDPLSFLEQLSADNESETRAKIS